MSVFDIHHLSRSYSDEAQPLLDDVSLTIEQGDFVIIQGASGSGKTTLVKLLTGSLRAETGQVFFGRDDIARYSRSELQSYKQELGLIFQHNNLLHNKTVYENIVYPLRLQSLDDATIATRYEQVIASLGIEHLSTRSIAQLSGGERQKVAYARALIKSPTVIIADEPTGNLDRSTTKIIADDLITHHQHGHTTLLVTHDLMLTKYIAEQISSTRIISLKSTQSRQASEYTRKTLLVPSYATQH